MDRPGGTVTLLFTDIEGSTQLLRRLGDAYAGVLAEHQRLLREAFAAHGGREVDTQGDAFFVAFPSARAAVEAAVAAQRALAAQPWPDGAAVRVRMGLHTGEPAAAGERYVGLAVHRAARVGAAGHGGQVLLSAATQAVLRDDLPAGIALRDLGEHRLKDFDQAERLYQLVAPGLPTDFPPLKAADPAPLPPLPVPLPASRTPLVGRERELALLREHLDAALGGQGGLVLLGGEAGVGKTTLAEALGREALARGARVAIGRCYDLTETPPYGPWREALAALPASPDLPPLPGVLGGPERGEAVASQEALFARAHAYLAAVVAQRPLVLPLDDLHWADPASLDLLRFLARQLAALPLLLVATYRADELTRRHPLYQLLPLLVREARAVQLDLRALPDEAVRALVRARYALAGPDEARLVAYLRERAEGHPLFVGEVLRTLEEEGLLRRDNGGWHLGDPGGVRVPRLLRQVIEGRLDRLGEEEQRLLAVAAVVGQEVPLDLWAAVAEVDEGGLVDLVERAAGARLVEPTGAGLRFAHALIREALYEGLSAVRRRIWHRRVGEALTQLTVPDPDAVAYHLQEAGDARAVEWLFRAGERAQQSYAWITAAERYKSALDLMESTGADVSKRGWLLYRLALLRRYADPQQAIAYLASAAQAAAVAGDPFLAAYAAFDRGLLLCFAEDAYGGLAEMEAGLADLDRASSVDQGRRTPDPWSILRDPDHHWGTFALWLAFLGHYARAQTVARRVRSPLISTPAAGGLASAFAADAEYAMGLVHAGQGRPEEARQALRHVREAYSAVNNYVQVGSTVVAELRRVVLPYQADHLVERNRLAAEAEEAWKRASGAMTDFSPRFAALPLLILEGHWREARQLALAVYVSTTTSWWPLRAASMLGPLAHNQGDSSLAWQLIQQVLPAGSTTALGVVLFAEGLILAGLAAMLAIDARDLMTAQVWLETYHHWLTSSGSVLGQSEGQRLWATYLRTAGDAAEARQHAALALDLATKPRQPLAMLAAHRLLGELDTVTGAYAEAQAHLDQALALAEACAAPYERALTLLALTELRHATGSRDAAQAALDEARPVLERLEARPALARAAALAIRGG